MYVCMYVCMYVHIQNNGQTLGWLFSHYFGTKFFIEVCEKCKRGSWKVNMKVHKAWKSFSLAQVEFLLFAVQDSL